MSGLRLFISAGEPSGDLLAGELLVALKRQLPDLEAFGICGPRMRAAGAEPLFGIEELSVMGFVEVLKHLPYIKRLEFSLLTSIERRQPQIAILVDYPGFHLRLAESLKMRGIYVCQYVAPQLWAWGEKRTAKLKACTDEVLGIMPFEAEFFRERAVNFRYVGTPQVDRAKGARRDRERFALGSGRVIGFFPGSRPGEVSRLLPRMLAIRTQLRRLDPTVRFAVSAAPHLPLSLFEKLLETRIEAGAEAYVHVLDDTVLVQGHSIDLMKSCDAALVTSGTATLECALVMTPMAVIYVMQNLSYQLAKRFVKLPHISLVNLVAGKGLVREFIQDFDVAEAAQELLQLARPGTYRDAQSLGLKALDAKLQGDLAENAAAAVATRWQVMREGQNAGITAPARS